MFVCDLICMKSPTLPVNAERSLLDSCSDLELHEIVGVKIGVGIGSFSVPFCCQAVQLFQLYNFLIKKFWLFIFFQRLEYRNMF